MEEGLKCWGLWVEGVETWLRDESGRMFVFYSPLAAKAQLVIMYNDYGHVSDYEVREIK